MINVEMSHRQAERCMVAGLRSSMNAKVRLLRSWCRLVIVTGTGRCILTPVHPECALSSRGQWHIIAKDWRLSLQNASQGYLFLRAIGKGDVSAGGGRKGAQSMHNLGDISVDNKAFGTSVLARSKQKRSIPEG